MSVLYQKTKKRITHLSKHPFLVEAVDEEDGGLSESHEEVTDRQVHDEVVWQVTKLLITAHIHTQAVKGKFYGQFEQCTHFLCLSLALISQHPSFCLV